MDVSKEKALELYRRILFIRLCEEKIRSEYFRDEMKTPVHLSVGAEAIAAGVISALPEGSQFYGTYRNHAAYLAATGECEKFFGELYGKITGCAGGKAGSMHMSAPGKGLVLTSAVVATTIPVATGTAFAEQYLGKDRFVAVFFGDGAVEEGVFWESLNFASLKKLRILFVCEDNELAIHATAEERRGFRSLAQVADVFDCYRLSVCGYQPFKIYEAVSDLAERMRKDPRPAFCHFPYYRFYSHVGVDEDFSAGYRNKPAESELSEYDPVIQAGAALKGFGIKDPEIERIRRELESQIHEAVEHARAAPLPGKEELYQ
jgi:pyruvate dehydrogenase E1 component alpha subunit